jgi:hypothetical protein
LTEAQAGDLRPAWGVRAEVDGIEPPPRRGGCHFFAAANLPFTHGSPKLSVGDQAMAPGDQDREQLDRAGTFDLSSPVVEDGPHR